MLKGFPGTRGGERAMNVLDLGFPHGYANLLPYQTYHHTQYYRFGQEQIAALDCTLSQPAYYSNRHPNFSVEKILGQSKSPVSTPCSPCSPRDKDVSEKTGQPGSKGESFVLCKAKISVAVFECVNCLPPRFSVTRL